MIVYIFDGRDREDTMVAGRHNGIAWEDIMVTVVQNGIAGEDVMAKG